MLIFGVLRTDIYSFKKPLAFIITGTIVLTVSLNIRWFHDRHFRNEVTSETHRDYMLGDPELIEIGQAIQNLTPESAIIASNYFCDDPYCSAEDYSPHRSDWKRGGEAMGLVMYAHRRFLVSGYGYLWQNVRPSDDVIERLDLSVELVETSKRYRITKSGYCLLSLDQVQTKHFLFSSWRIMFHTS